MDGIHDLGGMQGFGSLERDEAIFHSHWERRAFGMAMSARIDNANTDDFRHSIERLDPAQYLTVGYFGRWMASVEIRLEERGLLNRDEVDSRVGSDAIRPRATPTIGLPGRPMPGGSVQPVDRAARFAVGQAVRTLELHPTGHTRLPGYVRGSCGVVALVHPSFVFPDTNAHGLGAKPQHVYAVKFRAADLWGAGDHMVHVDLFEDYLEAV